MYSSSTGRRSRAHGIDAASARSVCGGGGDGGGDDGTKAAAAVRMPDERFIVMVDVCYLLA